MNDKLSAGDCIGTQQKELNSVISSTHSRVMNLERHEKELVSISQRLAKVGMSINDEQHPLNQPQKTNPHEEKSNDEVSSRRPPAMLGNIFDIGEKAEDISVAIQREIRVIKEYLDYIERFI